MSRKGNIGFKWKEACVIANGQTTSAAVDLQGGTIVGIEFPTMTGATVTFTALSGDGSTYKAVNGVTVTAVDGEIVPINPINTACITNVKVVSAGAEGAERTMYLILQNVG